jgi:drug/metabolite transporter (DMT)-like permease
LTSGLSGTARDKRRLQAHLLLLAVVALWGATFVLVKDALHDASPMLFNLLRMALAFVCLAVVYRKHLRSIHRPALVSGAIVGACLAAGYQFQTTGLARTTPSKSAFITGMVVVLVPLLSAIPWLRSSTMHAPRLNAWLGALLAFAGVVLLTTPAGAALGQSFTSVKTGDLLTLGCAFGFALHVIALAHTSTRIDLPQLATLQIGFCAVYMAVLLPIEGHTYLHPTVRLVVALLIASVLATAAAFTIQSWAQQFLPTTHTALTLALEPVFAGITSYLVLGERLHARAAWGVALILAGIALTELFPAPFPVSAHESI